jgi:hypothetical protein
MGFTSTSSEPDAWSHGGGGSIDHHPQDYLLV